MTKEEIIEFLLNKYEGLVVNKNWGEIGLFYNPEGKLKKGVYLLTFKEKDGENDSSSNINRKSIYRLNLGISKNTFIELFDRIPTRPKAGMTIDMNFDFSALDQIMPHPVYGWMSWICVLNPSKQTFQKLLPLIDEGYHLALKKYKCKKL